MADQIYTFSFKPDWMELSNRISELDRFDASWATIEKREGQTLKHLKSIATVRSVGASTRIEGSKMTDDEVEVLIRNIAISKLEERDQQEVAGYFETLELIAGSFKDIAITEGNLKNLHNSLMGHSKKDSWHRGNYKQHTNTVQAEYPDGSKKDIFRTAETGLATDEAMGNLISWYRSDTKTPQLIKTAVFVYDFLSIHPFQDGNGRLSRLLGTLLLLKQGYSWIQYVSFEHEIENRKSEYYRVLMECQKQRPGEEVSPWINFFFDCMKNIQDQSIKKLEVQQKSGHLSQREKMIYTFLETHPFSKSGDIAEKLDIPLPSTKRIIADMVENKLLSVYGGGNATSYTIEGSPSIKKDMVMRFTTVERSKDFVLKNQSSFIEITKIMIMPLFDWTHPTEWGTVLAKNGLYLNIECVTGTSVKVKAPPLPIIAGPYHYQPVFPLSQPIIIPSTVWEGIPYKKDYPIQVSVSLESSKKEIDFDVLVIYNES